MTSAATAHGKAARAGASAPNCSSGSRIPGLGVRPSSGEPSPVGEEGMRALPANAMTIGRVARLSGVSVKRLRQYERLGLLYTLGRSESHYRLFDESTLWCLGVIASLRSLGLTLKEIQAVGGIYCERGASAIGPELKRKLEDVKQRVDVRMAELQEVRRRVEKFEARHALALEGRSELALYAADPKRESARIAS